MTELIFLGTGGGRFAMITQKRATGGFRLNLDKFKIHVDPGPGAIVRSIQNKQNPQNLNCIIVTHAHPDHATDTAPLIEAMCRGMLKERGYLIVSKSVIAGAKEIGPVLGKYHYERPKKFLTPKAGDRIELEENGSKISVEIIEAQHSDPTSFGVKFYFDKKVVGYTGDTAYFEKLKMLYKNCDILILDNTRPGNQRIPYHLCTEDTIKILKVAKPKLAILTHLGMKMITGSPISEAQSIERETGVVTLAAEDGMKVNIEESLTQIQQASLKSFEKK
ncbi:TPA: MBL fold metallo-hydrolase [archaeon]|uniref:MBL fold metallo-hydrolase n=1 Tax=Candidatus Naiadarchaeum limnaeum TaxID=2756139 RepID=A0A832V257_9ARCH|nr:MBL fold metallo-hydrolase [Candidatus Naiadarchaeum limnaeum]